MHLSLNENTFTFVLPQKSEFWEGRAGGVRKEKHGQLSAYGSARRKRRQLLATREFKDVQIGTMIFPNDLGITPQLFSCALLCIITFVAFGGGKICTSFGSISFAGWVVIELVRERERERINRERGLLVFVWGEEYKTWEISVST